LVYQRLFLSRVVNNPMFAAPIALAAFRNILIDKTNKPGRAVIRGTA
jgi:hypothetical protein